MKTVEGKYASALVYSDSVEDYALAQIKLLCDEISFKGSRIRVMPDVHPGKVGPVGFTATVTERILPSVVGVDIGCGMSAVKIKEKRVDCAQLDKLVHRRIPAGSAIRSDMHRFASDFDFAKLECAEHIRLEEAMLSIGTLGGGNHFIEADRGEDGSLYVVVHSGSRHLGKEVAEYYLREGQKVLKKQGIDVPYEMTYLEGELAEKYVRDVAAVQEYAALNRRAMLDEILRGMKWKEMERCSCVHNYIDITGDVSMIRKGAISARKDEQVIIPINMRDGIILGKGKGNPEWNCSAPHGAGRVLKREDVMSRHTVSEFKKAMQGIYCTSIGKDTLDEAPFAYRSIDEIKEAIKDSVDITEVIKPVYSFKAGSA